MIFFARDEFLQAVDSKLRLLALDYGEQRIGVAISDSSRKVVTPLPLLIYKKNEFDLNLEKIIQDFNIGGIVVGLPLTMSAIEGRLVKLTKKFSDKLSKKYENIPVLLFDERFSTRAADSRLREHKFSKKMKNKFRDSVAALILLESVIG